MILIVYSTLDIAGVNIAQQILKHYPFIKSTQTYQTLPRYTADINGRQTTIVALQKEAIYAQYLPDDFPDAELIVFISRHTSQSGKPTLTVHPPGNFNAAEFGGYSKTLSVAPALAMQTALRALAHYKDSLSLNDYQVSYEGTHHGPSLNAPALFVELGSSPEQWSDSCAAKAVAHSALTAISNFTKTHASAVLGIGGTHYNEKFTTMALTGTAFFGHMIPKYALSSIDTAMIKQCVEQTSETVQLAMLDWKGISSKDKPNILFALEQAGLPYQKI
jgi:D-aminoacyl-tRNA deacylase